MEGQISLKGAPGHVEEIHIETPEGKKIDLPPAALSAYGLNSTMASNESDLSMYEWRAGAESMGKYIEKTKPRQGWVVTQEGNRIEGEMQLKRVNGNLDMVTIKNDVTKGKFTIQEVKSFGLLLTINEMTKGGEKTFKQAGRNYSEAVVVMKSGEEKKGWAAFKDHRRIDVGMMYSTILYAETKDAVLQTFQDSEVNEVRKQEMGETVSYKPYQSGFLSIKELENKEYKDATRAFNDGEVYLKDGTTLRGTVAQVKEGRWYSKQIRFKATDGSLSEYGPDDVDKFTQAFEGSLHTYIVDQGCFVERSFDGGLFMFYRNPKPTTVNPGATKRARSLAGIGGEVGQNAGMKATRLGKLAAGDGSEEAKQQRRESMREIQGKVNAMSNEEIQADIDRVLNGRTQEQWDADNEAGRTNMLEEFLMFTLRSEQATRAMNAAIVVYYKEWYLFNKKDGTKTIVYKQDYKKLIEPELQGCLDYLTMEKEDQKQYLKWDNRIMAIEFLEKCYGGN